MEKSNKNQGVVRSAAAMSLGTMSSRILGLVRDMVLAAAFSTTFKDAFVVAFRLPNLFRRLFGEGSLNVSFIPVYVEKKSLNPGGEQQLSSAIFSLLILVTSTLSLLGVLFMPQIMSVVLAGEGFQSVAGKLDMTIVLGRIMFSYLFLVTTYAFFMAIANAHKKFLVPALAPAVFNLVFIIFALLPNKWGRVEGEVAAWGVLFGGLAQVLMVGIQLFRMGKIPYWTFKFKVPGVALVLKNMLPGLLGLGVLQIMSVVNIYFASRLDEGAHSFIYFADRILELPQSLIAISLGAALLPSLSEYWSKGEKKKMRDFGQYSLRLLLFLALPSAVGMFVLAEPIVNLLYGRGEFSLQDVQTTAEIVRLYSFLLVASSFVKVLIPSFYAIKNTLTPAIASVICLIIHLVLAHFLTNLMGLNGLVLATVISGFNNMFLLLLFYFKHIGPFIFKPMFKSLYKIIVPLVGLGMISFFGQQLLEMLFQGLVYKLMLLPLIAFAGLVYFILAHLCKVPEFEPISRRIKLRLKI